MMLRRGTRARFNLTDGTTVEGTVQRAVRLWRWGWKISRPVVDTAAGPIEAQGTIYVARQYVTFVQALHVETTNSEA